MISLELNFTPEQAAIPFREAGMKVELREMPVTIPLYHGSSEKTVMMDVWVVENPHNGKAVMLDEIFRTYIEQKKQQLFLHEENKLNIINLFTK